MNLLSLLTLFGGSAPYIDITPGDYPELHEEAACDKHRELVNEAQIEALQRRIVAAGGGDVDAILAEVDARCADDAPMF
jgi:hypothetical protein